MTIAFAKRNNRFYPRASRNILTAISKQLQYTRSREELLYSNLDQLSHLVNDVKLVLGHYSELRQDFTAQTVFNYCVAIAAQAIRLAEEGTREYSYASDELDKQEELFP
jgi:hypothetical protein